MQSLTIRPLAVRSTAVTGIAALVAAATITGSGAQPAEISPPRLLAATTSIQLTALAEPGQILTDVVKAALSVAATVGWFAAFPITLPGSLVYGALVSLWASMFRLERYPTIDPTAGLQTFFGVPGYLLQTSFTALGISLGLIEQPASPVTAASARAKASAAAIGSPGDILTNVVRLAVTVVGAAAWYLATPLTLPLSIFAAELIRGAFGLLTNQPNVSSPNAEDWSNGLALFGVPFQAVMQGISTVTSPAVAAQPAAGVARKPATAKAAAQRSRLGHPDSAHRAKAETRSAKVGRRA